MTELEMKHEQMNLNNDIYEPFGPEWQAEISKHKKSDIINLLRVSLIEKEEELEQISPLKKRIEELEAIAPEIFSTLIAIEAEISANQDETPALKRSWRTLDMIYKLLNPSTNGKQD